MSFYCFVVFFFDNIDESFETLVGFLASQRRAIFRQHETLRELVVFFFCVSEFMKVALKA
jgi:hypothetical protein